MVNKRSILDLPEGTKVVPSLEEYKKLQKASIYASLNIENKNLQSYQDKQQSFDNSLAIELIKETKRNTEAVKRNKTSIKVESPKQIDFEHELFRLKNTDWS